MKEERYAGLIEVYKKKLEENTEDQRTMGLLAYAYMNCGKIDEARKELENLIGKYKNFTGYRLMIELEKTYGDLEYAQIYALEAIDKFPNDKSLRKQLESINQIGRKNEEQER